MSGLAYDLQARVRGRSEAVTDANHGDPAPICINPRGDLQIAYGIPGVGDLTRLRNSYTVIAAAAVAPVTALPTTTAQLTLWNGEQENGKIYVLDSIGFFTAVSAGAATQVGMVVCMNIGKKANPAGAVVQKGLAGQVYRGTGNVTAAVTVTDDKWFPYGTSVVGPASQIGLVGEYPMDGLYVVPPGHMFSVAVIANTVTTITARAFIRWHEVLLPVG